MANLKSARKRAKTSSIRYARNAAYKSKMRTAIRHFETALQEENKEQAREKLQDVIKITDKLASKGIIHKNTAARKKSRLSRKLKQISS
jgi:small subunit ribosomal protein S20